MVLPFFATSAMVKLTPEMEVLSVDAVGHGRMPLSPLVRNGEAREGESCVVRRCRRLRHGAPVSSTS